MASIAKLTGSIRARSQGAFVSHSRTQAKELNMSINKDQVKGTLKDLGGQVQEATGKLLGDQQQQIDGLTNQVKGKAQKGLGDLKEAVSDLKEIASE
jgi:uncharacterized protein YjbJ (UPF0337 family)